MNTPEVRVAVGILVQGDTVLMGQRRPDKPYPLQWEFPGGKCDDSEEYVEALIRELREELHITVMPEHCHVFHEDVNHYTTGVFRVRYFLIDRWQGSIDNTEFHALAWIPRHTIHEYAVLPGNQVVCARLQNHVVLKKDMPQ
jgi:8-oxo-dGTP diphosphatase